MTKLFGVLEKSVNMIRLVIYKIRHALESIYAYLMGRVVNAMIPLQRILIKLRDTLAKTMGTLTAGLYTVYGAYLALKAFLGAFLQIVILGLIIAVAAIIILWIIPFTWPMAAVATIFFLLISIPTVIIAGWVDSILNIKSRQVPGKPGCFDKNTIIETKKGPIPIRKIKTGTVLKNGDKVTAVFKLALNNLEVFNLDGTIVTGCHKVFHENIGWIYVFNHPNSKKIDNYREPIIYCLSTESKRINIKNHKFLDWDDLEPIDIIKLKNLKYISKHASLSEIHEYLESGIDGNTLIELENGNSIKIKNIQINDQLYFGERVLGLVKINTKNICAVKRYKFKNLNIIGGPNLHFNDTDLGNFNTLNIDGEIVSKPKNLYHLLTDTGYFTIDGYKIRDYNSAIENILDIRNKLFALF